MRLSHRKWWLCWKLIWSMDYMIISCFWYILLSSIWTQLLSDKGSKPEILSRIAQTITALTRLKPVWNDRSISLNSKIWLMCSLIAYNVSSCMLVIMDPHSRASKPWKWSATTRYYTSHTKTTLPTRKSVPRFSRQLDHMKTAWPS